MTGDRICEINTRRAAPPRLAEDTTLVESLRFAVPLWIDQQRGNQTALLIGDARRCAWAVGERGDALMFRTAAEPTATTRNSAALAFNGLARGLAAIALLEGRVDAAGLHWCTRAHDNCPRPPRTPAALVTAAEIAEVVAGLDELEAAVRGLSPGTSES